MDFGNISGNLSDPVVIGSMAAIVVLPVVLLTRKHSLPLIMYVVEYVTYCALAHFVVGAMTRAFSWFKSQTTFQALEDTSMSDRIGFTTPFNMNFWQKELYNPQWIFWLEIGIAVALLYVVIFMRPLKFSGKNNREKRLARKKAHEQKSKAYAGRHQTARARR